MGWWSEANRGAAREFGRRHAGLFATFAVLRSTLPALLVLAVIGGLAGGVWALGSGALTTDTAWVKPALTLAVVLGVLAGLGLAWRRWGLFLRLYGATPVIVALVVLALAGAGTWFWLT
jgi:hypothetical protein